MVEADIFHGGEKILFEIFDERMQHWEKQDEEKR